MKNEYYVVGIICILLRYLNIKLDLNYLFDKYFLYKIIVFILNKIYI